MNHPTLHTLADAAGIFHCSRRSLLRYVQSGKLGGYRIAGRILIEAAELTRFLEANRTSGAVKTAAAHPRTGRTWTSTTGGASPDEVRRRARGYLAGTRKAGR